MKKNNTHFNIWIHYIQMIIGLLMLLYYIYLNIRYGLFYIVFSWTFALMGSVLLIYGILSCFYKKALLHYLPKRVYQSLYIIICVGSLFFSYVEANILFYGWKPSQNLPSTAIVLGAQLNGNSISRLLRYRLEAALTYANDYPNAQIIVSGGQGLGEARSEASAMKDYLVEHGVDEKRILIEDQSMNTQQNLANSKAISPSNDVVIITNNFHSYRSKYLCEEAGFTCSLYPAKGDVDLAPNFYFREFFGVVKDQYLP